MAINSYVHNNTTLLHYYYYNHFTALRDFVRDYLDEPVTER